MLFNKMLKVLKCLHGHMALSTGRDGVNKLLKIELVSFLAETN